MSKSNLNLRRKELKRLSAQLHHLLADSSSESSARIQSLLQRIRKLIQMLRGYVGRRELSRILGVAALCFGLGSGPGLQAQSFGPAQVDPFGLYASSSAEHPCLVDIDGDGDLDLMAGGNGYDYYNILEARLYYFENKGTSVAPQFAAPVINPFGLDIDTLQLGSLNPEFGDLDGDGDLDMLVSGYGAGAGFFYFENTGTAQAPAFAQAVKNPFGFSDMITYAWPHLMDLDGDGDYDILNSSIYGDLNFSENTGTSTSPSFAAPVSKPFGIQDPVQANASLAICISVDLDQDGDLDLFATNYYSGEFIYYKNVGTSTIPQFDPPLLSPSFLPTFGSDFILPEFADLDGDGDFDLLVGTYSNFFSIAGDEEYVYHENTTQGGVSLEELKHDLKIYPNLVTDYIHLEVNDAEIGEVLIFDQAGKMLLSIVQQAETIDVAQLAMGSYVLQVILDDGRVASSEFVKN